MVLAQPHVVAELDLAPRLKQMPSYRALLRTPGLLRVILSQLLARFPFGMMSLGFIMHIEATYGSYTLAGITLGAQTLGCAISGPILGRWLGRFGTRALIATATAISASSLIVIAVFTLEPATLIALASLVGLAAPPIQPAVRTIYPELIEPRQLTTMFSLDAALQEVIWIVGPVLATFLAATISPEATVLAMGVVQVVGVTIFLANPEVGRVVIPVAKRKLGRVLKNRSVVANVVLGSLLVASFAGVEVGTVGLLDKTTAGLVISLLSIGSLLGGIVLGKRIHSRWSFTWFMLIILAGYAMVFIAPTNPLWLAGCWFIAGIGIAPALGALGAGISIVLGADEAPEAYGWVGTGQLIGYSASAAIAGIMLDNLPKQSTFALAVIFAAATALVAVATIRYAPDLSKHHQDAKQE